MATNQPKTTNVFEATGGTVPLYRQLVQHYRHDILDRRLKPGDRVPSINQLQCLHGVSRETAKRALNTLAEEGYVVQRAGKGSFVAELGPSQPVWGMIYPVSSLLHDDLALKLAELAQAMGRELRTFCDYNDWREEVRLVGAMLNDRFEAIIVVPTSDESRTWDFYSRLSPLDSPVVLFDHTMSYRDFPFVVQSYDLGVVRAMDYLLAKTNGRVAFLSSPLPHGRNMVRELMLETYREVLRRRRPREEPIVLGQPNDFSRSWLEREAVGGLFCCDDISAIRALGRLREQGVAVPDDVRVVSYGNTDLSRYFTPSITSINPHTDRMVAKLVELLSPCIEGGQIESQQFVVQPDIIVRET